MDQRVQIVIVWMQNNLQREVSADGLAELVNLSPSRLRHLFKVETKMPLNRYLKRLRMERARELLENTLLTIKQVRMSVGVQSKAHFTQDFKQTFGMTPIQYRHTVARAAPLEK